MVNSRSAYALVTNADVKLQQAIVGGTMQSVRTDFRAGHCVLSRADICVACFSCPRLWEFAL